MDDRDLQAFVGENGMLHAARVLIRGGLHPKVGDQATGLLVVEIRQGLERCYDPVTGGMLHNHLPFGRVALGLGHGPAREKLQSLGFLHGFQCVDVARMPAKADLVRWHCMGCEKPPSKLPAQCTWPSPRQT